MNKNEEQSEWRLDALAGKMVQYCYLLEGLTGAQGGGDRGGACVCVWGGGQMRGEEGSRLYIGARREAGRQERGAVL